MTKIMKGEAMKKRMGREWWVASGGFGLALTLMLLLPKLAGTSPAPGLSAGPVTNGYLGLTVTNGVTNEFYEIYGTPAFDAGYTWTLMATGALQQTNFSVLMGPGWTGFYRARAGTDWDGDGIPNWQDGDPGNTNIGALTVTIETPANGSTIQ